MTNNVEGMKRALRTLGVNSEILSKATAMAKEGRVIPKMEKDTLTKVYNVLGKEGRCVITLSSTGNYKVFTLQGHAQMKENGIRAGKVKQIEAQKSRQEEVPA